MKIKLYLLTAVLILLQSCVGQSISNREFYNEDFNWRINIPEEFNMLNAEESEKMAEKGIDAIEKTYDEELVNHSKTIFAFRSDKLNYFDSTYQPFDVEVDGDYMESVRGVNEILYETFITQMEGIEIDTSSSTEVIDQLEFKKFKMKITYPNKIIMNLLMYCRLFDKQELSVNIMYVDKEKGKKMLHAWRSSTFNK